MYNFLYKEGINKMMKEMKTGFFTYNDESYEFVFKTSLSAYEKMSFVKSVVDTLVNDGSYNVIVRDLITDFTIIDMFTNIDTSFVEMKDEDGNDVNPIIPIEHFLEETSIVDVIKENMEYGLLDELNKAIDLNIQYLTGIYLNPISESIASLISAIENKIGDFDFGSLMDMANKFAGMTEDFTIDNLVNAYMGSDVHKKNLLEIEESKKN